MSETSPISDFPDYHRTVTHNITGTVDWTTPGLKIMRLRFISDPGFKWWDVSYCHGQLPNGDYVHVQLPFNQLLKHGIKINSQIVDHAKRCGINAKAMGIFDAISTFN